MVTCPRCAQPVDETAYSTCPHCSTPLPAAQTQAGGPPQAQAPQGQPYPPQPYPGAPGQQPYGAPAPPAPQAYTPSAAPGTRVSLTGEVIEDKPSGPPPSYVGGGAAGRPVGVARPTGPNASRSGYSPSRSEAPSKSGGGGMVVGILLAIVLIGGGIGAGWWFLVPHSNPKTVVQQYDAAIAAQDWKTVYNNVALPDSVKSKYKDADAFATEMTNGMQKIHSNPMTGGIIDAFMKAFQTAQVGEPTIDGDTATVPVKMTVSASFMGQQMDRPIDIKIPLTKVNGAWKVDGSKGLMPSAVGGMGGSIPGM